LLQNIKDINFESNSQPFAPIPKLT
jgi:hypothetical protein